MASGDESAAPDGRHDQRFMSKALSIYGLQQLVSNLSQDAHTLVAENRVIVVGWAQLGRGWVAAGPSWAGLR